MILSIDFDSEEPIYSQIRNEIVKGIAIGELEDGDSLPSVRSLAVSIGVNMHTVNKSYNALKDEGFIQIDKRKGAFISLNLKDTNKNYKNKLKREFEIRVAECYARGIKKEELINLIEKEYDKFNK
ncbi:MAG: GntR family transcriptional regulator [Clostridium sp.]|uniref:GntR family transcriptional regulator n=1 Tax=Clostridium sp. TaxID=1506 RepID=UPI003F2D8F1C